MAKKRIVKNEKGWERIDIVPNTQNTASTIGDIPGKSMLRKHMITGKTKAQNRGRSKIIIGNMQAIAPNQYKIPFFIIKLLFKQIC